MHKQILRKNISEGVGVFGREERILNAARSVLEKCPSDASRLSEALADLSDEYEKLGRRSLRLVSMSDRMQGALSRLNRTLAVKEQKYRGIFENAAEGMFSSDREGCLLEVNPALAAMFGFSTPEMFMEHVHNFSELFCCSAARDEYEDALRSTGDLKRFETRMKGRFGSDLWVEISAAKLIDEEETSSPGGYVGVVTDVTERKAMLEELCRLARTDGLTGLWNRRYFLELGSRESARAKRSRLPVSLLMIDIDHFKAVNDTYGHDVGDEALKVVSEVLRTSVRELDIAARIGGEEFAVLLPEAGVREARGAARRICSAVRTANIETGGSSFSVSVSIGTASSLGGDLPLEALFKRADIALYDAKKGGRDRVESFRRE